MTDRYSLLVAFSAAVFFARATRTLVTLFSSIHRMKMEGKMKQVEFCDVVVPGDDKCYDQCSGDSEVFDADASAHTYQKGVPSFNGRNEEDDHSVTSFESSTSIYHGRCRGRCSSIDIEPVWENVDSKARINKTCRRVHNLEPGNENHLILNMGDIESKRLSIPNHKYLQLLKICLLLCLAITILVIVLGIFH